jgi:hypothetical protein
MSFQQCPRYCLPSTTIRQSERQAYTGCLSGLGRKDWNCGEADGWGSFDAEVGWWCVLHVEKEAAKTLLDALNRGRC